MLTHYAGNINRLYFSTPDKDIEQVSESVSRVRFYSDKQRPQQDSNSLTPLLPPHHLHPTSVLNPKKCHYSLLFLFRISFCLFLFGFGFGFANSSRLLSNQLVLSPSSSSSSTQPLGKASQGRSQNDLQDDF